MGEQCQNGFCAVEVTMNLLQPKWTLHIVRELQQGKRRFNELAQNLGGVNPRTLCLRLRHLEEHDVVRREILSTIPPWVEYSLTEKGRALSGVIQSIESWGRDWMTPDMPASSKTAS